MQGLAVSVWKWELSFSR